MTLAAASLGLASCMAPAPTDPRIHLLDGARAFLQVTNARVASVNGVPMFAADLTNTSPNLSHDVSWLVEFRDMGGLQVASSDSRWTRLHLRAGETRQVKLAASNPNAADFVFKARRN